MATNRELLLLRHAKSSWDGQGAPDHDRDLAPRGIKAARRMGKVIATRGWAPDLVLCSTALRAQRTLSLVLPQLCPSPDVHSDEALYMATESTLLQIIRAQPMGVVRLMLIGHNPGMQGLALSLAAGGKDADLAAMRQNLPTAGLARLGFVLDGWERLQDGELLDFIRPRQAADD